MRKPLLALSLTLSTGLGAIPVASTLAASTAAAQHPTTRHTVNYTTPSTTPPSYSAPTYSGPSYNSAPSAAAPAPNAVSGAQIVSTALKYLGYPYTATGNSPSTGFSCIGFVSFVYRSNGISLPGDLGGALAYAPSVPFGSLLPGDILYFQNTVWNGLSHAAIYLGGGRFVHAEWYGYGVRISSFNGDPKDGNYWTEKYLGANRPWSGAAVAPIVPPSPPAVSAVPNVVAGSVPSSTAAKVVGGTTAVVSVRQLNVRTTPSKASAVQQVVIQGATVTVIGHRRGWYHVQLQDGTVGWVVAQGIGKSSAPVAAPAQSSTAAQPTIGVQVVPVRQGAPAPVKHHPTMTAKVDGLRVHTSPSVGASVVTSVSRGQHAQVLGRSGNWVKVRLSDGTVGWVIGSYAKVGRSSHVATKPAAAIPTAATYLHHNSPAVGKAASVPMNVHNGPSLTHTVVTVIAAGSRYQIVSWSGNWARVLLPDGTTGWVSGTLLGHAGSATTIVANPQHSAQAGSSHSSVLTAGVRVHAAPGTKSAVVTLAAAGTHVRVLGHRGGWTLVRLPSGTTGYVLGSYVR